MKTIGILGGLSPESTIAYYRHITQEYTARFGDYSYPEILIYSVQFQRFVDWQKERNWEAAADKMIQAVDRLYAAGADFGIIATNTMHVVFDEVAAAAAMPMLSIIDATAEAVKQEGLIKVGLIGTIFTIREPFFREKMEQHGISVVMPQEKDLELINSIIFDELCRGVVRDESRKQILAVTEVLSERGAEGIICGCTEIPLLISQEHCGLKMFNTTTIHAKKALDYALQEP